MDQNKDGIMLDEEALSEVMGGDSREFRDMYRKMMPLLTEGRATPEDLERLKAEIKLKKDREWLTQAEYERLMRKFNTFNPFRRK